MKLVGLLLCSSLFLAVILNKAKCEEYLGCYKDGDDPERLLGHLRYFHDSLTPQVCITYCTGYAYAGLQDGNQCFCGDDEPNDSKKTEDKECDHRCTGDRSQICGGDWRDTVYKLTHAIKAAVGNIPFTYLGCYTDQANPRMLQGSFKDFGDYMTPLQCVNFCKDAGYHYAGLQYRTQCFCGDQTPKTEDKVSEKRCVARCSGDITTICGGNWKSTVYATGLTKLSTVGNTGYKYEGCFKDVEESRRLGGFNKDFGDNLVPKDCIELCKRYGYQYAGLQFRIECFCGDELLQSDKRPDSECVEKCSGDVTQLCGAGFRNTVYNTGLSVKANIANIGYTYLGCYKDQADPRLLQGYYKDFGDYLSPLACVEFCKNLGYIHAGVEYRTQCFCGDQKLESKYKVPDTECKSRCGNEDINSICGGAWKVSVYSTGLTQVTRVEDIGYKYEGCYRDNVDKRRLNAFYESFEDNLVPKKCVDLCKHKGYRFAGLQNRVECFCGDADLLPSNKIPDSECQHRCSGDVTKICGGSSKNTVYSTGNTVKASIADIGFSYLGCYRDSNEKRRIQGDYKEFEEDLTPEICVNYCKKMDYKYAGMQYSKECYCGNDQPLIQDRLDDSECSARCSGDNTNYCGGNYRNTIYSTNIPGSLNGSNVPCEVSVTTVNGYKPTCKGEVVFFDNFSGTSISNKWSHVVQIANEWDSEFVVYKKEVATSYTNDGHLVIKPIVLSDSIITSGRILLSGCTGIVGTDQCEKQAKAYLILPPVESARLISRNSFSFRYGRVDIRAKLPKGDWLVPDILLESKGNTYGTDDSHSRIRISMSRGNQDLLLDEIDLGCKSLEVGIAIGEGRDTRRLTTVFKNPDECWHLQYHDFSLIWSNDNITFVVDGAQTSSMIKTEDGKVTNGAGFNKDVLDLWSGDTNSAAFDSDFYITLGVSVGGGRNFPDNAINRGRNKPWMNSELKRTLNFWKDRKNWERTWSVDSALHVDYVKVTAL